jgi:drug/metabolite transporter (DMT)-like permease
VLGRFIAGTIPPVTLAQIRWSGAAAILLPFAWPHLKADWPAIRARLPIMLFFSFTGVACYNTIGYYALQYTQAINALLIQSTGPLLIAAWSLILFRDRLSPGQLAGILASLAGVTVILSRGDLAVLLGFRFNRGDVLLVLVMAIYAAYSALLRTRPRIHWMSFLGFTVIAGQAMILPAFAVELALGQTMRPTPAAFAVLGYVVLFPSVIAYLCFNRGVELIGANRAGPFFHLSPLIGSVIAILFLGETLHPFHFAGYALILGGIAVAQGRRR